MLAYHLASFTIGIAVGKYIYKRSRSRVSAAVTLTSSKYARIRVGHDADIVVPVAAIPSNFNVEFDGALAPSVISKQFVSGKEVRVVFPHFVQPKVPSTIRAIEDDYGIATPLAGTNVECSDDWFESVSRALASVSLTATSPTTGAEALPTE